MTVQIKTKKTVEESREIQLPAFFKHGSIYVGIFDHDIAIKFYAGSIFNCISVESADRISDLDGFEEIDEQDFRIEYMKHMEKFALPKYQITTGDLQPSY